MSDISHQEDDIYAKGLWLLTVGLGSLVLIAALFLALSYSLSELMAVALAVFVAVLVSRYEIRLPRTNIEFATGHVFTFWGVVWLGLAGGCLLTLASSLARWYRPRSDARQCSFRVFSDLLATIVAATVYYFALGVAVTDNGSFLLPQTGIGDENIAAIILMTGGHYLADATLTYLRQRILTRNRIRQLVHETLLLSASSYLLSVAATLIANYTFVQFGLGFGWVILPLAILGTIAHTIHTQRLASKTREISESSRIHLATVEALATAIDARDQVGLGHVRRTQLIAVGIGQLLGLTESELSALRAGALLHDIGKLAVPDHILNKPGPLTQAEIEKTKIHASVGASILEKVGFDTPVVPTVKYHHENWDGSGYPEGLKGENIPLTARILSVADAYDTLRGARPYRPAVSRSEAYAALRKEAGRKFDPRLVKVFLENLDYFEAEIDRHGLCFPNDEGEVRFGAITASRLDEGFVEQIKSANREASTLYELAREFSSSLNLEETLSLFVERIQEFVPFETCSVFLLNEKSGTARAVHVEGADMAFRDRELRIGEAITGQVLETRSLSLSDDLSDELAEIPNEIKQNYRSMVSLPLIADEHLIGAVSLYSKDLAAYGEEHLRLLETLTKIASDAILKSKMHAEAENHALTDPMTGLPNARSLHIQFERESARSVRSGASFQLLMLDLDGFKQVNDTHGHKAGDKMLSEVGKVIRAQLRDYDFLARYAGDEFVVIVPDSTSADVFDLCHRIEQSVGDFELHIGDSTAHVGVSVGSASFPQAGTTFDQLLIAADKSMYTAKMIRKENEKYRSLVSRADTLLNKTKASANSPADSRKRSETESDQLIEIDESHIVSTSVN